MILGRARNQRGAGAIGCLFLISLLAAGGYAGYQLGLPRLRHTSFVDRVNDSIYDLHTRPAEMISKQIIETAAEFDIALKPDQVKVVSSVAELTIEIRYEKFVDLHVWQTTLPFHARFSARR